MITQQNNVIRLLQQKKIPHTVHTLSSDQKISALEVAELLHVPESDVYKTIVIKRDKPKKNILALIPAGYIADLKAIAPIVGEKKVALATQEEAETLTGLLTGGISPLALINKGFDVIIDDSAKMKQTIIISAGERGLQVEISPVNLAELTRAKFFLISKES